VIDVDGDGYGATIDCDDGEPSVHPGAEEHCDGVDEDCDGEVDEEAVDAPRWSEDLDGDGWGGITTFEACEAPDGYVAERGDCDETDPAIHPGAVEECEDEVDSDCDGDPENGCSGDLAFLGEIADGEVGDALAVAGDVDGDGIDDLLIGAPDGRGDSERTGRVYLVSGSTTWSGGSEVDVREVAVVLEELGDSTGFALAGIGDLDGDGFDDLAIGAPQASEEDERHVLIGYGPLDDVCGPGWDGGLISAGQGGAYHGYALASAGDLTGDGQLDLAVGSPFFARIGNDDGLLTVYSGPIEGEVSLDDAAFTLYGSPDRNNLGWVLAGGGDHDGDGQDDLLASSGMYGSSSPGVVVVSGPVNGSQSVVDLLVLESTIDLSDKFGCSISWAGDWNGDGYDDILIGDTWDFYGLAYLVLGPLADGEPWSPATTFEGTTNGARLGHAVLGDFDLDGDGALDIAVGAPSALESPSEYRPGTTWIWLDAEEGTLEDDSADLSFLATTRTTNLGATLAALDLNNDGLDDLAMGAPGTDLDEQDEGAVWIAFGGLE